MSLAIFASPSTILKRFYNAKRGIYPPSPAKANKITDDINFETQSHSLQSARKRSGYQLWKRTSIASSISWTKPVSYRTKTDRKKNGVLSIYTPGFVKWTCPNLNLDETIGSIRDIGIALLRWAAIKVGGLALYAKVCFPVHRYLYMIIV